LSTGNLWDWVEEPCARCTEQGARPGTSPILDVPVFFPQGPEEHWTALHRPLCSGCLKAERSGIGQQGACEDCPENSRCAAGNPPFKGTCAALATTL